MILDKFMDETKIEKGSFINDNIRLSKENQQKLIKGDGDAYNLINRPQKKFELSLMITGGNSSKGLSDLIILEGPENKLSYTQFHCVIKTMLINSKEKYILNKTVQPHTRVQLIITYGKIIRRKGIYVKSI